MEPLTGRYFPPVPRSNAEVVRELYAIWNRGGAESELIDPRIEYVNPPDAVEPGTRRGLEGWRTAFEHAREAFDQLAVEAVRVHERGERVLAEVLIRIHARGAGIETELRQGHVWTLREGRAIRFEWFNDPAAAWEAFGEGAEADEA